MNWTLHLKSLGLPFLNENTLFMFIDRVPSLCYSMGVMAVRMRFVRCGLTESKEVLKLLTRINGRQT